MGPPHLCLPVLPLPGSGAGLSQGGGGVGRGGEGWGQMPWEPQVRSIPEVRKSGEGGGPQRWPLGSVLTHRERRRGSAGELGEGRGGRGGACGPGEGAKGAPWLLPWALGSSHTLSCRRGPGRGEGPSGGAGCWGESCWGPRGAVGSLEAGTS